MYSTEAAGSRATAIGTRRFAFRVADSHSSHFRHRRGLTFSSLGIGTYLGAATAKVNREYIAAITQSVRHGCNVIDTARNYRSGQSEHAVGAAIRMIVENHIAQRDELIVCSKAGYLLRSPGTSPFQIPQQEVVDANVLDPKFLRRELS